MLKYYLVALASIFLCVSVATAAREPRAMLIQAKGEVSYSKKGTKWRAVRRNKFLFDGYQVKTGADSSCKLLVHKEDQAILLVAAQSHLTIGEAGIEVMAGQVSETTKSGEFIYNIKRKFAKVQKYTVVRRAPSPHHENVRLHTARLMVLNADFPDLVWQNVGPAYAYRLQVGERSFDVPGTATEVVRFTVPGLTPGNYDYGVAVVFKGEVIYQPPKKKALKWLNEAENQRLEDGLKRLRAIDGQDSFLIGSHLDEMGLRVAAMDQFRRFFKSYPYENEIRPFLIKVYDHLKLEQLKEREIELFNAQAE